MLNFIYSALDSFRSAFSRHPTWLLFCMIVLGFIGSTEMIGVTSFCRFWGLGESAYHSFLNFFRSEAFSLQILIHQWTTFVIAQGESIMVQGRAVLLGDHTYVPKNGRRMAWSSNTSSKLRNAKQTLLFPWPLRGCCLLIDRLYG